MFLLALLFILPIETLERPYTGKVITRSESFESRGTFVILSDHYVLTNYHVTRDFTVEKNMGKKATLTLVFSDKSKCEATIAKTDPNADLALLRFEKPLSDSLHRIAIAETMTTGRVTLGGYEKGIFYEECSAESVEELSDIWFRFEAKCIQGQSGSPVIDEDGKLCGLIWGSDYPDKQRAYAVTLKEIRKFLEDTEILSLRGN